MLDRIKSPENKDYSFVSFWISTICSFYHVLRIFL